MAPYDSSVNGQGGDGSTVSNVGSAVALTALSEGRKMIIGWSHHPLFRLHSSLTPLGMSASTTTMDFDLGSLFYWMSLTRYTVPLANQRGSTIMPSFEWFAVEKATQLGILLDTKSTADEVDTNAIDTVDNVSLEFTASSLDTNFQEPEDRVTADQMVPADPLETEDEDESTSDDEPEYETAPESDDEDGLYISSRYDSLEDEDEDTDLAETQAERLPQLWKPLSYRTPLLKLLLLKKTFRAVIIQEEFDDLYRGAVYMEPLVRMHIEDHCWPAE
jgi:hypothetical protein